MLLASRRLSVAALALIVAGCGFTGPRTLELGRPLYNLAVQRTNTEQLLLNLVRLRYRDTWRFRPVPITSGSPSRSAERARDTSRC